MGAGNPRDGPLKFAGCIAKIGLDARRAKPARRVGLSPQKRIGPAFRANGRTRTVAAQEGELVSERQQLCSDRVDQRVVIAIGEIGPANRALEQHVAHQRESRRMIDENNMSRRVAWAVQNIETMRAESDRVTLL